MLLEPRSTTAPSLSSVEDRERVLLFAAANVKTEELPTVNPAMVVVPAARSKLTTALAVSMVAVSPALLPGAPLGVQLVAVNQLPVAADHVYAVWAEAEMGKNKAVASAIAEKCLAKDIFIEVGFMCLGLEGRGFVEKSRSKAG